MTEQQHLPRTRPNHGQDQSQSEVESGTPPPAAASTTTAAGLIDAMTSFVTECMRDHDPSHNPAHVHRVVALAHKILEGEQSRTIKNGNGRSHSGHGKVDIAAAAAVATTDNAQPQYDALVVTLAALLHDIGDRKYLPNIIESSSNTGSSSTASHADGTKQQQIDPSTMVEHALLSHGASPSIAARVQTIVSNVSYTNERANPDQVRKLIFEDGYPELAIVQDADRLDALGAVGIGRCFTFLGSEQGKKIWLASTKKKGSGDAKWEMENSIEHFGNKLEKLEGMMKTQTGRGMARVRTERLKVFKSWWEEEMREIGL